MSATCETCRFWARDPNAHGNIKRFDCRRRAPSYQSANRAHWCGTLNTDWCGEHQPITEQASAA